MKPTGYYNPLTWTRFGKPTVITILGNTPSLKNHKQAVWAGNKLKFIPGKPYREWASPSMDSLRIEYGHLVGRKWAYPLLVDINLYRNSIRRFDWINVAQGPFDLLQAAGIITEDDMNHVIPGHWWWEVDKECPRVELHIWECG